MACNCKVNQQITYLHKKYGQKIPVSKESKIRFTVREWFKNFLVYIIAILFTPIIFLYILYVTLFTKDKRMSMKKVFNLSV